MKSRHFLNNLQQACVSLALICTASVAAAEQRVEILYIEHEVVRPAVLSSLVTWPEDEGEQGAELGIADNNTTGKFLKQFYALEKVIVAAEEDITEPARLVLAEGAKIAVLNMPAEALARIAALPEAQDDLLLNAGSADTALRAANCLPNLLHTLPSRAMLADALMQLLAKRRWKEIFLLEGNRPDDAKYASALRRAAKKFGLSIKYDKKWVEDADLRRNAAAEVPAFTQGRSYDVVIVADEAQDFGQYVMYNTWLPRPVAGSAGIEPQAWHPAVEQWGAQQLQSRFTGQSSRAMNSIDYASWAAVRTIGEAVTRTSSAGAEDLRTYILSEQFALAAFKGAKMSYRPWSGQLRQPIPLVHPKAVVALAPLEGYLHQHNELDTLGLDKAESLCNIGQ